jgi:hypothetical protein
MYIYNVEMENDEYGEFCIEALDLKWQYGDRYSVDMDENQFFDLALCYLNEYVEDVVSTDFAKIDCWVGM